MKNIFKKSLITLLILISIIFFSIPLTIQSVSADNSKFNKTSTTEFGSIATYDLIDKIDASLQLNIDFKEQWLNDHDIDNYAGIEIVVKVDGIGRGEFSLTSSTNNDWTCTGRDNLGDGSNRLLLEKNNPGGGGKIIGDKNVSFVLSCPLKPNYWESGSTATFSISSIEISSDNGTLQKISSVSQTVTSTIVTKKIGIKDGNEERIRNFGNVIYVKSSDESGIVTFKDLCDNIEITTDSGRIVDPSLLQWSYMYKGKLGNTQWKQVNRNEEAKVGTGLLGLTRQGRGGAEDYIARYYVVVLGDCSIKTSEVDDTSSKVNINDVTLMRGVKVGETVGNSLSENDYLEAGYMSDFVESEAESRLNNIETASSYAREKLSIADIIRVIQRILTKGWDF